ncbi:MAG: exopolysaccharide biosynthesis protein [Deltaproteobacteria bacterium]|nr:exopolysaccharide biosynthesis protein [Deltaproteobacteria bacterium]
MTDTSQESFMADLAAIERLAAAPRVSFAAIEQKLEGRGFASFALIFALPFVQPIPLPGVSIVIGLVMIAVGLRLTLGHAGVLPQWLGQREIDGQRLVKMVHAARKAFTYIDPLFKPRLSLALQPPLSRAIGLSITVSGLALILPLPPVVLFSNSLPAWAIICVSIGYLERDGLFVIIGHLIAIATWVYFATVWEVVRLAWHSIATTIPQRWPQLASFLHLN